MSNIYEKMQSARVDLQNLDLKKTGQNKFSGYLYYELRDFLPQVNMLMKDYKLFSDISFGSDLAVLTITNAEKPDEKIAFTSPIAEAQLKGCHPIQNLGAVQTYLRRYLYTTAFEIVENDTLDATTDTNKEIKQENKPSISDAQIKRLYAISKSKGITEQQVKEVIKKSYNKESTKELTKTEYDAIVKRMEAKEDKK